MVALIGVECYIAEIIGVLVIMSSVSDKAYYTIAFTGYGLFTLYNCLDALGLSSWKWKIMVGVLSH